MNRSHRHTLTGLAVIGGVMTLNSAVLGSRLMLGTETSFSEVAGGPTHLGYQGVLLACVAGLNLLLPRLAGLLGGTGRGLPAGLLGFAAVATFLDGGTRFVEAFVTPWLADASPALLDDTPGPVLMAAMAGSWVLFSLALAALGVVAYRRRVFPRPACVLLVLGGLAVPAVGPLSGVLIGPALAWAAGSRLRRERAASVEPATPVAVG